MKTMSSHGWTDAFFQALSYSDATLALARYWHSLPREDGTLVPLRAQFQLTAIASHLDEIYLSKWKEPGQLIVLACGSRLVDLLGEDITGKDIFTLSHLQSVPGQISYYQQLRALPGAGVLNRWGANMSERPFVYRTVQLPLLGDSGEVDFFIGTGVIRSAKKISDHLSGDMKVSVEHQEQVFLDIGAGVPESLR